MKVPGKIWFAVLIPVIWAVTGLWIFVPQVIAATSPSLGTAESYSVIAGSAVTNSGITSVNGDMGISPGTTPPNFTDSGTLTISGTLHDADAQAATVQTDIGAAYTSLSGQNCDTDYGAVITDLSGRTLDPGVYCASAFTIAGTLTLKGSPTDVWIFKSAGDLTGLSANVVLTNGGNACSVWWYVPGTASIDAGSSFVGTIIADTNIVLGAGATLNGRVLARTADVALDGNTISGPTCVIPDPATEESSSDVLGDSACTATDITTAPIIIEAKRTSATSVSLNWGPYEGMKTFIVEYGPENGNWLYNTKVSGFTTTINDLPVNQPMWFRVAATDDCGIGPFGNPVKSGSTPTLPDTGLGPKKNTSVWLVIIPVTILIGSLLFVFGQIKRLFSFKR